MKLLQLFYLHKKCMAIKMIVFNTPLICFKVVFQCVV